MDGSRGGYDFDTLADALAAPLKHLDLRNATLVGHSAGTAEIVRYLSKHGSDRVCGCAGPE
ncbi:alpha/beta fold hydrolase [Nocardia sp. GCM10030253]|uniref:alpha/beta fold hydrolase n=1 Tax=Nocardia sp. GCM10030253 TaxID=3273404 RepID=UPI00362C7E54